MKEKDEVLNGILQSADRHPNSRVSKLIRTVESERTQKNIVLLLIELAENVEYATDFGISLKYYLDLFEQLGLGRDIMLNETGLLLLNSSKIYSRRVDFVHELIERQILTLSNADREIADANNTTESSAAPEKPKRGRKRLLEAPKDPYEVALQPKKFRKITHEKRFAVNSTNAATARANQIKLKSQMRHTDTEQNIHPAGWVHSSIVDLENDEEIDSKRNYKLFTYHVEHRYNTLVADINFRLHFMVKDFIDAEEEQLEEEFRESGQYPTERATTWPPLSEAYVKQYLQLENRLLECGIQPHRKKANLQSKPQAEANNPQYKSQEKPTILNSAANIIIKCSSTTAASTEIAQHLSECNDSHICDAASIERAECEKNESGLGDSLSESNVSSVKEEVRNEKRDSSESGELVARELNTLGEKDSETSIHDENKIEKQAECAEIANLETAQNSNKNEESEIISTSILNSSTNILDDALNSTSIISSTMSSNEFICSTTIDLSTSIISGNESIILESSFSSANDNIAIDTSSTFANESLQYDSALGSSICDSNTLSLTEKLEGSNATPITDTQNEIILSKEQIDLNSSAVNEKANESLSLDENFLHNADQKIDEIDENKLESCINLPIRNSDLHDDTQINFNEIRIHMPHLDDEGVFFSDLDEQDQRMLSPTVMALDVFPSLNNKNNFTIIVDDDIRAMLNIASDEPETYVMPEEKRSASPVSITLNIMELPEKMLRRRLLFKLGSEYELFLKARMCKRKRGVETTRECRVPKQMKWFQLNDTDMSGVHVSPINSPGHSSAEFNGFSDDDESLTEFYGFPEDDQTTDDTDDKYSHRLSRDSGVDGVDGPNTIDKTSLNTIAEEELEGNEEIIENLTKTEENITEAIAAASTNDSNKNNANDNSSEIIESNSALNEIIPQTEDLQEKIKPLTQEVDKAAENDESTTNVLDIVDKLSADIGDGSIDLDTTNDEIYSVQEITEAQNLDALLDNDDNNVDANNDIDAGNDESTTNVLDIVDKSSADIGDGGIDLGTTNAEIFSVQEITEAQNLDDLLDNDDKNVDANNDIEQTIGDRESCVLSQIENELGNTMADIELNSSKTKIQKWHEHLQPILSKSRERHHFDVFQIGTEIMNELEEDKNSSHAEDLPKCISFQDVMQNKDASYVSRYFLSSLLLANQSNIKITVSNKSSEEPTAWKNIQFDLLSTKRHTVSIEDNIGMVKKGGLSDVPKLKAAKPQLKRAAATISSTKSNRHNVNAALSAASSSCYTTHATQQETTHASQLVKVNLDVVKPLKHIEKLPQNGDDYDSGIFSSEELM